MSTVLDEPHVLPDAAVEVVDARPKKKKRRLLFNVVSIVVLCAFLFVFWPARFGGKASFLIVKGTSMNPTYHVGDLLYVREVNTYKVGDPAVYKIPAGEPGAGFLVVHRVKEIQSNGRYVMQGDNKKFADDYRPRPKDMMGKPLKNLGQGPTWVILRLPFFCALAIALAVTWLLWPHRQKVSRKDTIENDEGSAASDTTGPAT